jgi:hypothetical protein
MTLLTATWSMTIDEDTLIKEMLETGEYGLGEHPINDNSMIEFFRNWAFGLDPDTYEKEWARNPLCHYALDISENRTGRQLFIQIHLPREEKK